MRGRTPDMDRSYILALGGRPGLVAPVPGHSRSAPWPKDHAPRRLDLYPRPLGRHIRLGHAERCILSAAPSGPHGVACRGSWPCSAAFEPQIACVGILGRQPSPSVNDRPVAVTPFVVISLADLRWLRWL